MEGAPGGGYRIVRWPWQKREVRESTGGYTTIISQLIEAQAAGTTQQASATAAVEAAAGLLSRDFMGARVDAPDDIAVAITPQCLALIGRDLMRVGESLHVIRMAGGGRLRLVPCSTWYWEGDSDPATWLCTATAYGPSGSTTWRLPSSSVVFVAWGAPTARPYHGLSPSTWAAQTSRLHANIERLLADEAGGPVAQLLPIPVDGGDGKDGKDDLAALKVDIGAARGKALLVETTSAGWSEGKAAAPMRDWRQSRLGADPPEALVNLSEAAFLRVLAAAGVPPSLFVDADGTAQREALRRWHMGVVRPLARQLEAELSTKMGAPVRLAFDNYPKDMVSRAQVFAKLIAAEGVTVEKALEIAGLLEGDAA